MKILNWALARLKEKSTWAAIFTLAATALGVTLEPALKEAIITAGMAVSSAVLIGISEK
jgi:hypothetical protein